MHRWELWFTVSCSASRTWLSVPAVVINSCITCGILQIRIFRPTRIHLQLQANACSSFQWLTWRWTLPFWLWNCSMHPKHKCKTGPRPAHSGSDMAHFRQPTVGPHSGDRRPGIKPQFLAQYRQASTGPELEAQSVPKAESWHDSSLP